MSKTKKTTLLSIGHKNPTDLEMFDNGHDILVGSLPNDASELRSLRVVAHNAGYTLHPRDGRFVSFKKSLFTPKTYRRGETVFIESIPEEQVDGVWATVEIEHVGPVSVVNLNNAFAPFSELEKLFGDRPDNHVLLYAYRDEAESKLHVRSHETDKRVKSVGLDDDVTTLSIALLPEDE